MKRASSMKASAMKGLKSINPIGNVSEVLKGGVAKNAGKILKPATGPIVKTIMNLAEFGMILSSDEDKKTKSKRYLRD